MQQKKIIYPFHPRPLDAHSAYEQFQQDKLSNFSFKLNSKEQTQIL